MIDIHTHHPGPQALFSVDITGASEPPVAASVFSAGVHPWNAGRCIDLTSLPGVLSHWAAAPRCVAIGECGLDRRRGPSLALQMPVFESHIDIAESVYKPLVLHCVGCSAEMIRLKRLHQSSVPWIIHGFRGKPEEARQLLSHGFYLSLGARFNPLTAAMIPADRLLLETDESLIPDIQGIAAAVAEARHVTPESLTASVASVASRLLSGQR